MEFCFGRKRGAGIKDEYVHMYCVNIKEGFKEIYKEKKDILRRKKILCHIIPFCLVYLNFLMELLTLKLYISS